MMFDRNGNPTTELAVMGRRGCALECREPTPTVRLPVHRRFCPRCRHRRDEGYCDGFPPPEETSEESREGVLGVKKEE
ncbi:hypothetical protein IMZ48_49720 [Candidatus Bathyarchaeota archaeon]|nr:hypothetical protein [Candidatus Bathyarchaeota archaeon]